MKYPKTKAQSRTILAVVMIHIPLKSINLLRIRLQFMHFIDCVHLYLQSMDLKYFPKLNGSDNGTVKD